MTESGNDRQVEIILVEDNSDDVTLSLTALKKANIWNPVHVLKDGMEALDFILCTGKYADRQPFTAPQVVLLDLNLPKVHGLDVLRKIKSDERTKSIPVVILTASQEERGVMQSYKLGAQGCIVKPFELAKFMEAVGDLQLHWLLIGRTES